MMIAPTSFLGLKSSGCLKLLAVLLVVINTSLFSGFSLAGQWESGASLSVGATYTDNVQLQNANETDDFAAVVTPAFSLNGEGSHGNVDLIAALQFNSLDGDAENFNPNIRANADIEVLENFFFVDFAASARQSAIDSFSASGFSSLNETGNSTATYQYSVSPYISSKVKDIATYQLRYNMDDQLNETGQLDDSSRESGSFTLLSGEYFGRFSWGFLSSYSKTDFEDRSGSISITEDSDNEFISSTVQLGYRLNKKWRLTTSFGKEWNDFISTDNDVDGDSWGGGVTWTPNSRVSVSLGYGERFFGETPSAEITYRHKRSLFNLVYSRSVTDSRSIRQLNDPLFSLDALGRPANVLGGNILGQPENFTSNANNTLIDERLDFSYSLTGRRTTVSVTGSRSEQNSQDTGFESIFSRYSVSLDRRIVASTSVRFSYTWDEREDGATSDVAETDFYALSFARQLGPNTDISLNYSYTDRDSDRFNDDFSRNRISFFIAFAF